MSTAPVFVKRNGERFFLVRVGISSFSVLSASLLSFPLSPFPLYYACCIPVTFGKLPNSSSSPVRCEGQRFVTWWQPEPVRPWPCAGSKDRQVRRLLTRAEVLNNTSPAGTGSAEAGVLCQGDPPLGQEVAFLCIEKKKRTDSWKEQ